MALALFYRFVLSAAPSLRPEFVTGSTPLERPLSSGSQNVEIHDDRKPIGQPVEKYEGLAQCSGGAMYINDLPPMKDELWSALVVATKVRAKIAQIDTSPAMVSMRGIFGPFEFL